MKNAQEKAQPAAKTTKKVRWTETLKRAARSLFASLVMSFEPRQKKIGTVRGAEFHPNGTAKYKSECYDYSATISQIKAQKLPKNDR